MRITRWVRIRLLLILGLGLCSHWSPGISQTTTSTAELRGRILDENGSGLPGVLVTLENESVATGTKTMQTDIEGRYVFRLLPTGRDYMLKASVPDYATVIAGPLELHAGRTTELNLTLKPSSDLEETIRVEARGELAEVSNPAAVSTFNSEFVEGVPLVGRRFADLLTLAPGVTDADGDGNMNVRGARDTGLQLRLDGTNVTDPLSGHFGQDINLESIEEVEVITAAAAAEYGRADGGFANVITKSGGNQLDGSVKAFYRSDFLDGKGSAVEPVDFNDTDFFFTAGGPLVRDHLWYFGTVELLDREEPVIFLDGSTGLKTREGMRAFGKVTWQASADHKLALQINYDPLEIGGNNIGRGIDPQTDYLMRIGGPLPQLTWTAILSPSLLLQMLVSQLNGNLETDPVSDDFRTIEVEKLDNGIGNVFFLFPCETRNCRLDTTMHRLLRPPAIRGATRLSNQDTGPYSVKESYDLERSTFRSDLSWSVEEVAGQHAVKGGFEFNVEKYSEEAVHNPILTDRTCSAQECPMPGDPIAPVTHRRGELTLQVFSPVAVTPTAENFAVGAYLQNSWKPVPNLTINFGLRYDQENIESSGHTPFDPVEEAVEVLRRFDLFCDAAGTVCTNARLPGRPVGPLPALLTPPPGHPSLEFDLNGDGILETSGKEGIQIRAPFTNRTERLDDAFLVTNSNLAPRLGISWDPWADGKTRFFGSWGKYYDRLFLGTVATEQGPESLTVSWTPTIGGQQADPGTRSNAVPDAATIPQTDHGLQTPYTIEWSLGVEREIAPEWAVALSYVSRRGRNLLQDLDINHITCKQFDTTFNTDPYAVCGDGGFLEVDRFGAYRAGVRIPNGATDLYVLNPEFNQVLRVGNYNTSEYWSADLTLRKRLHRNWQMLFSYTYSKAFGDAESFISSSGNDPGSTSDKVAGYLDFDQRHVVKWQVVTHLPREILLGGTVNWGSGLPFTFVDNVSDFDETDNLTPQRIYSVTGFKNDQRNEPLLTVNLHAEKRLTFKKVNFSGFLDVENVLDEQEFVYRQLDKNSEGIADDEITFGRRWQIGAAFFF